MSNLTPEPRADVNGKITTRWVRPDRQLSSQTLNAVPHVSSPVRLTPPTREIAPILVEVMEDSKCFDGVSGFNFSAFHPLVVQRIEAMLMEARGVNFTSFLAMKADVYSVLHEARLGADEKRSQEESLVLHNFAVLGSSNGEEQHMLIAGLKKFREFRDVEDFLLDLDDEGRNRAAALFKVKSSIGRRYLNVNEHDEEDNQYGEYTEEEKDEYILLNSDELANFVMDHHELVDDVIRVVRERKTIDVEVISGILTSSAPAISDGVL